MPLTSFLCGMQGLNFNGPQTTTSTTSPKKQLFATGSRRGCRRQRLARAALRGPPAGRASVGPVVPGPHLARAARLSSFLANGWRADTAGAQALPLHSAWHGRAQRGARCAYAHHVCTTLVAIKQMETAAAAAAKWGAQRGGWFCGTALISKATESDH